MKAQNSSASKLKTKIMLVIATLPMQRSFKSITNILEQNLYA
jgi:hypothetical protein